MKRRFGLLFLLFAFQALAQTYETASMLKWETKTYSQSAHITRNHIVYTVRMAGLRFHDLRHHAITELAESQASDSTVMAIAGHVSPKMLAHYSHVRLQAKRTALDALSTKRADKANSESEARGYDTNRDTKRVTAGTVPPQVLENLVELVGIEPTTSSLRTMRSPS